MKYVDASSYSEEVASTGTNTSLVEKDALTPRRVQYVGEGAAITFPEVDGLQHRYERRAASRLSQTVRCTVAVLRCLCQGSHR